MRERSKVTTKSEHTDGVESRTEQIEGDSPSPSIFQIAAMASLGFFSLLSYEIARTTIQPLFQDTYGAESEPWGWIGVGFAVTIVVSLYGRAARTLSLNQLGVRSVGIVLIILGLLGWSVSAQIPGAVFLLFIWKDIYIVVIIELFWSFANSSLKYNSARWLYGLFCFLGGIGAVTGDAITVWLSQNDWHLLESLWFVGAALGCCVIAPHFCPPVEAKVKETKPTLAAAFVTVKNSRILSRLLAVVVLSQICITLVHYDFSLTYADAYPNLKERQKSFAEVNAFINGGGMGLQLLTGLILYFLKLRGTLVLIPSVLGLSIAVFLISPLLGLPALGVLTFTKIASKSMDYSLFRATKELLYLPLTHRERVEGKAVVDVLGYRIAKVAASAIVLLVTPLFSVAYLSSALALALSMVWIRLIYRLIKEHSERAS